MLIDELREELEYTSEEFKKYRRGYNDSVTDIIDYIDREITLYQNTRDNEIDDNIIRALKILKAEIKQIFYLNNPN